MMIMMVSMIIMMIILVILMIIMTRMTKKHRITVSRAPLPHSGNARKKTFFSIDVFPNLVDNAPDHRSLILTHPVEEAKSGVFAIV